MTFKLLSSNCPNYFPTSNPIKWPFTYMTPTKRTPTILFQPHIFFSNLFKPAAMLQPLRATNRLH
ncbi:unnamed protein product [Prunus brigantina]